MGYQYCKSECIWTERNGSSLDKSWDSIKNKCKPSEP